MSFKQGPPTKNSKPVELPHPVSALCIHCQARKIDMPVYEEQPADVSNPQQPMFSYIVQVAGCVFGPSRGPNKSEAKTLVSISACDCLGIKHAGLVKKVKKEQRENTKRSNVVSLLYEYCQLKQLGKLKDETVRDDISNLEKRYGVRFKLGDKELPMGVGRSKDIAKKRAASRAMAHLKGVDIRDCFYGEKVEPLGKSVAEHAWEAFGILCEELGETQRFCQTSQLAAFVLENMEDGSFRVVSMGTGFRTAHCNNFARNGESVIDSHAVVIARRGLLFFIYEQLLKLFDCDESIFEYGEPLAVLKQDYKLHLYMKEPPCGDAFIPSKNNKKSNEKEQAEVRDHTKIYTGWLGNSGYVQRKDGGFVVSCSDKIMLWNFVGVQGNLLQNVISPIYIRSITVSYNYDPEGLARALCCRFGKPLNHPWICYGPIDGILPSTSQRDWRQEWSIYWTHSDMDLDDDLEEMVKNAGILHAPTGMHLRGSTREREIPLICKRNLFRKYKKVCLKTNKRCQEKDTYCDLKNMNSSYRLKKNEFFQQLDMLQMGRFPIMDRSVDIFLLTSADLQEDEDS